MASCLLQVLPIPTFGQVELIPKFYYPMEWVCGARRGMAVVRQRPFLIAAPDPEPWWVGMERWGAGVYEPCHEQKSPTFPC